MNEGTYSPPFYTDLYNFRDGAQNDIFQNSYDSIPPPSPNQTVIPQLINSPNNTSGMPALPSSSSLTPSSSISPSSVPPSPMPSYVSPTTSPSSPSSSPPPSTVTSTVYITVVTDLPPNFTMNPSPSSSTVSPTPSPSGGSGYTNVAILNKRKPMCVPSVFTHPEPLSNVLSPGQ